MTSTTGRATARRVSAAAAGCLALLAAGCASSGTITMRAATRTTTTTASAAPGTAAFAWGRCDKVDIAVSSLVRSSAKAAGMECATLAVPLDHAHPDGRSIGLAVARLPATGKPTDRIGSLIANPGGPGGSGLEFLAGAAGSFPQAWRQQFDIVSFDPRGIAASTPLDCLTQPERAALADEQPSDDPATAQATAARDEKKIADGCRAADEGVFTHMGTDQVVGDLDDLRAAVGDDQLTFLGLSYGTRIAAGYASAFPANVRALVLDGSVTPSRDLVEQEAGQIKGINRALGAFVAACNADATCPLAPDAMARLDAVAATLKATPLTVTTDGHDQQLTKALFVTGVVTALYDPAYSMPLAASVAAIGGTDPTRAAAGGAFLLDLAGKQTSKQPDGTYGNGLEAQGIVNCSDADSPLEGTEVAAAREQAGPLAPLLDSDPATDTPSCLSLPTGDGLKIGATPVSDRILIVGTDGDPATPIEWTRQMTAALGRPAVIVYGGHGHTASLNRSCVTDQVTEFLVQGHLAVANDCPADPSESDIYAQLATQITEELGGFTRPDATTCIAAAIRQELDPLEIVKVLGDKPDMALSTKLATAALGCR